MSKCYPYNFDAAEDLCKPLDVTNSRRVRVRYLPPSNAGFQPAIDVRRFTARADGSETHASREGFVVLLEQIDDFINMLVQARDRLRASGRLEAPAGCAASPPAHRKGRVEPEKRSEVLRLAAAGLSVRQIEAETGVPKSTVSVWIAERSAEADSTPAP